MADGLYGSGNYSTYTSRKHSNFAIHVPISDPASPSAKSDRSMTFKFIWDPFFNSSALNEIQRISTKKHTPVAFVYTSIGLWFARTYLDEELMDIAYRDAMNRVLHAYKSLAGSVDTHSLFLAPTLHPYDPLLNEDRAKTMTHSKVSILNGIIRATQKKLQGIYVPTIYNTFSKGNAASYDAHGIHFTPFLSGLQANLLTNLRCNAVLTNKITNHQSCCSQPPSLREDTVLWSVFAILTLFFTVIRNLSDKSGIGIVSRATFWVVAWYAVLTGVGGVKREIAESTDVYVSVIGWLLGIFFWMAQPGSTQRLRFSILGKVHSYYDSAKGFLTVVFLAFSFFFPNIAQSSSGAGAYWLFANLMAAFLVFDSTRFGSVISYSASDYITHEANSAEIPGEGKKPLLGHLGFAVANSFFCNFAQNCLSIFLVAFVKRASTDGIQKVHSPPFLIFQSEIELAAVLLVTSLFSWLFFLVLRQTQFSVRHYHPSEIADTSTRSGFKGPQYCSFAILICTIYAGALYLTSLAFPTQKSVVSYPGIFVATVLSSFSFHFFQLALPKTRTHLISIAYILLSISSILLSALIVFTSRENAENSTTISLLLSLSPIRAVTSFMIGLLLFILSTSSLDSNKIPTPGDASLNESKPSDHYHNKALHDYSLLNTIGTIGQHSQEFLLLVLCVFYLQVFENSTVDAAHLVAHLENYYWTIPRFMWFHLSPLPFRAFDTLLTSLLVILSTRSLADVATIRI